MTGAAASTETNISTGAFLAYVSRESATGEAEGAVETVTAGDLPADGVLVRVEWSSVNYKDALAATLTRPIVKESPLIPGIDLAGELLEPVDDLEAGTKVICHGQSIGSRRHGGWSELARVPKELVLPLPDGLSTREAMILGTAGFTAALSVLRLEEQGMRPDEALVLVTGASGGFGSIAVDMLSARGYCVVASTGKAASDLLRQLGAVHVIDRDVSRVSEIPAARAGLAGAIDCVGGATLEALLPLMRYGSAVSCCGMTAGLSLKTSLLPFIANAVTLIGIDSVQTPVDLRRTVWERLGSDLKPPHLELIATAVEMGDLGDVVKNMLAGQSLGRTVVQPSEVT